MFRFVYNYYFCIQYPHVLIRVAGVDGAGRAIVSGLLVCRRNPHCHCPNAGMPVKTAFQRLPVFHHNCTHWVTRLLAASRVHCSDFIWRIRPRSKIKQSLLITNAHLSSYLQHIGNQIKPNQMITSKTQESSSNEVQYLIGGWVCRWLKWHTGDLDDHSWFKAEVWMGLLNGCLPP